MIELLCKKLDPRATLPKCSYDDSRGYDVFPLVSGVLFPGVVERIFLGFSAEFSPGYTAIVDDRGSMGVKGITHLAGVIDSDYRDEWAIILINLTSIPIEYSPEKAIAQVLFIKTERLDVRWVEQLSETKRGTKCLGSTDEGRVIDVSMGFSGRNVIKGG